MTARISFDLTTCDVPGCDEPVWRKSLCTMHLYRLKAWGNVHAPSPFVRIACPRCGRDDRVLQFDGDARNLICIACPGWTGRFTRA